MKLPLLLSLSESARLFGVSQRTLRRAIGQNQLRHTVINGRYKLNFADLISWSESSSRYEKKRDEHGIGRYVREWKSSDELSRDEEVLPTPATNSEPKQFPGSEDAQSNHSPQEPSAPSADSSEPTLTWD